MTALWDVPLGSIVQVNDVVRPYEGTPTDIVEVISRTGHTFLSEDGEERMVTNVRVVGVDVIDEWDDYVVMGSDTQCTVLEQDG